MEEKELKIRLYLEICSACNLKCKYCFEKDYIPQFMDTDKLFNFANIIKPLVDDIVITGGEPTLHPDFFKIVEHFPEHTSIVITTNGSFLNINKIKELLAHHSNVKLQFSLDAIDHNFVDFVRGEGIYFKILDALYDLKEFSSQLSISSTLTLQTPEMIEEIYAFTKANHISCYFPSILPYGALVSNWSTLMPTQEKYICSEDKIFELIANDDLGIIHSNKLDMILGNFLRNTQKLSESTHIIKVDAFGHILCCPATDYANENSRITDIENVQSCDEFEKNLSGYSGCKSADRISSECADCSVEKYCQRTFCGNCIHLCAPNEEIIHYLCNTFKYHYKNLEDAFEE